MWGSVPCIHQNGDITGYSVQYRAVGSENKDTVETSETEITLLSLTPETDYEISVAAVNTEGIGVSTNTSATTSAGSIAIHILYAHMHRAIYVFFHQRESY
jgi:hypothetical protein